MINPHYRALKDLDRRIEELHATYSAELDDMRARKQQAYHERNRLVQFISKLFPSHLYRHPDSDKEWEDDWRWIVCIHPPQGQATWHIQDSELSWFDHLPRHDMAGWDWAKKVGVVVPENWRRYDAGGILCCGWDGHTTEEKYKRLEQRKSKYVV